MTTTPARSVRRAVRAGVALLLAACTGAASAHDRTDAPARGESATPAAAAPVPAPVPAPAGVIDSIMPIEEALRRFRAPLGAPPRTLDGTASRAALFARFRRAVEVRDTAALRALVLTRGEFAYLYYPESPLARPPYEEPPALLWLRMSAGSDRGLGRLLRRYGGQPLRVVSHACEETPKREGANTYWERCRVRHVRAPGDTVTERLFGSVVQRAGRYKFVGYANDF